MMRIHQTSAVLLVAVMVLLGVLTRSVMAGEETDNICEPAMLVFDASGSMRGTRILEARMATQRVLPALTRARPVGLVTYGGREGPACGTIDIRLPPTIGSGPEIQGVIEEIDPIGRTPLTTAVAAAAEVLGGGRRRGLIVLVTDGEENCGGDPCLLGRQIAAAGGRLKVHVIGYRLRVPEASALGCLARSTGGLLVEASSADDLATALQTTFGCVPISRAPRLSVPVRYGP